MKTARVKLCLKTIDTLAPKQHDRHLVLADFTAEAKLVVIVPPRIVVRNADRLRAESADAFRIAAAELTARAFRPADLADALVKLKFD